MLTGGLASARAGGFVRFEEGAAAKTCVYRFLQTGIFQCKVHTMPRQRFLPTIPTDLQNIELQSVEVRAFKKLRYKPLVIQRDQKRKRLIVSWRIQPIPVREQFLGCFGIGFQRRFCDVQKPPPHLHPFFRVVCKHIVQNALP